MTNTRLQLGEYEVGVVVEGEEVEHYAHEVDEEAKVATCWIASTAGKRFVINVLKSHIRFDCGAKLLMDGLPIGLHLISKGYTQPRCIEGARELSTRRPFMFGTLELTDDESHISNRSSYEHLGEVKVTVHRVTILRTSQTRTHSSFNANAAEVGRVHERAKKSLTHQIMFGEAKGTTSMTSEVDIQEVVATFIFRYRSLDMLKAMGIAPREATPVATPLASQDSSHFNATASSSKNSNLGKRKALEVKVEGDSEDEIPSGDVCNKILKLERELMQLKESLVHSRAKKKMKQEPRRGFIPGEVIDLTL